MEGKKDGTEITRVYSFFSACGYCLLFVSKNELSKVHITYCGYSLDF